MFPYLTTIEELEQTQTTREFNGKSFLFDFKMNDFIYSNGNPIIVEGKEALKVWIEKMIRTEKFRFAVHKDIEYGITIDDLIGSVHPREFIESEMEREITEALLTNPYIESIDNWAFEYAGSKTTIYFDVTADSETFANEVLIP